MTARVEALLEEADHLVDDEQLDAALAILDRLLATKLARGDKVRALMARASIHDDLEDHDKALADCATALKLDPKSPDVLYLRSTIHQSTEDWQASKRDLDAAIEIEPEPHLYESRGEARYNLGDYRGAREDFAKAIAGNPEIEPRFHVYRGMAALLLDEPREAIADFTAALDDDDRDVKALAQRAKAYEASGDPKRALADLDRLRKLVKSPLLEADRARVAQLVTASRSRRSRAR